MGHLLLAAAGEALTHAVHHVGPDLAHHHSELEENPLTVLLEAAALLGGLFFAGWLWTRRAR